MTYEVVLTDRAHEQMEAAYSWWAANRSAAQAARWYNTFAEAIVSLEQNPERCLLAPEDNLMPFELRDLLFGIGKRPTHRAVFTIRPNLVLILAIRHLAQESLSPEDL
jgi:plasmid stabilization system protein ParE